MGHKINKTQGTPTMKITKKHLTKLIKEELEKSIEEAEGAKGVIYWPFVGGKIDKEDIQMAKDTISDYRKQYDEVNDGGVVGSEERERINDYLYEMEKILRPMSRRHKKSEFDKADKAWRSLDASLRNALGDAKRALKRQGIADEESRERSDQFDRDVESRRRRDSHARSARADQERKDKLDRQYGSSGRDDYHLVNPGFAGTGNMGYGESLDRAKISKSELAQIIKEELENLLK